MNFQKKLIPYVLLVVSAFMLWNTWEMEHAPKTQTNTTSVSVPAVSSAPEIGRAHV